MTERQVKKRLRQACEELGSQYQWATKFKLSPAYVSDVVRGSRQPGEAILKALSLERVITYREVAP